MSWAVSLRRTVVEDIPSITIADLPARLRRRPAAEPRVILLDIASGNDRQRIQVELVTSEQHFGGHRAWLRCPRCGSRRGRLLIMHGRIGCRARFCLAVPYRSEIVKERPTTRGEP
jgi:hypothetical protein